MSRVYLADEMPEERSTLRLMLFDLKMEIAGESKDWSTTLAEIPICSTDLLVADWKLLPNVPPLMPLGDTVSRLSRIGTLPLADEILWCEWWHR